jgi:membrane peptidoglycan carboxypeptidase
MRDRLTGAYEALSREVRSLGRRDDGRNATPSRARRDAPPNREWDDSYDDFGTPVSRAPRSGAGNTPPAPVAAKNAHSRSLAMRLIDRRKRLRAGQANPALRALGTTVIVVLALIIVVGGGLGTGYAYALQQQYAAQIARLGLSREFQTSRIYDRHGQLLYQTISANNGTRDYLDYCDIPELIQRATIDTEDHNFYSNNGVDLNGILRAALADATHSGNLQGASTITQQLVKLSLFSDNSYKQNLSDKAKQAILALSVNDHYTKQDILTMYLNIVPYGYNYEGVEAAAENYFHLRPTPVDPNHPANQIQKNFLAAYLPCLKDRGETVPKQITMSGAYQLQPWQAILLAGVPNNPNTYNPYANPLGAVARQTQVLATMVNYGDGQYLQEWDSNGNVTKQDDAATMNAYTQAMLTAQDPKTKLPLNIYPNAYQGSATTSSVKLAPFFVDWVIQQLSQYFPDGAEGFATAGWNVYTTLDYGDPTITTAQLASISIKSDGTLGTSLPNTGDWLSRVGLEQYSEYIVNRNITQDFPDYWYCGLAPLSHPDYSKAPPTQGSADNPFATGQNSCFETPLDSPYTNVNDAALTAIDPHTGDVLAMVGGVNYNSTGVEAGGQNNVAISKNRSMGSSFKPIVYATAMQMGWYPGTIVRDQPTCFPYAGNSEAHPADGVLCPGGYLPHNDEYWTWGGPEPLHVLLGNSLNTPAEMTLSYVGLRADTTGNNISPLIPMAQRMGITTLSPGAIGPSTAIGTQAVPLIELTSAYGTLADQGYHVPYRALLTITYADGTPIQDKNGHTLFAYNPHPSGYQAISSQAAFMVTSMLDDNNNRLADFGADNPLHFFGRDVAAKTGTSDGEKDIVTMGYTPWLSLGVWSGNADSEAMQNIIGIAGAGYIFHDVMAFAINRLHMPGQLPSRFATQSPDGYFPVPTGMHRAILNCNTGLAPWKGLDVTNPKTFCDPAANDQVPPALTPEFLIPNCGPANKLPPINPNEAYNCGGNPTANKTFDSWEKMGWGNESSRITVPGQDISWMIDGQDPTVP